jgi:EmrB/QacA subfamily drug resistance transporter
LEIQHTAAEAEMTHGATTTQSPVMTSAADRLGGDILRLAAVVILGTIMTVLDLTITNVAIPVLRSDLRTSIPAVQWVLTGYMLAFATVIPLTGWAAGRFGARRVWLTALLTFLAGSVLAGTAPSIGALIAFRVLQGLGAGMIVPVGQAILAQAAGPQKMGRVMSIIGVPMMLAPIFGPVLGGAIISAASWRWIFFINLPVGAAAILVAIRLLPARQGPPPRPLDVRGVLLLSPGIAALLYGLSQAGGAGIATTPGTITALTTGTVLIAAFCWHASTRASAALIDITLFRRRGFAAAAALNLLLLCGLFGSLLLLPLYYQLVRHAGPMRIGLLLGPQGLGAALVLPFAGKLTDKIGARAVTCAGILTAVLGLLAYTRIGASSSEACLAAALLIVGAGMGATIVSAMAAGFQALDRAETPRATAALNTIQRLGGAIGTALFAMILSARIPGNAPANPSAAAFAGTFWAAAGLTAAALVPALLLPRRQPMDRH